jgi:adenylate kinase
MHLPLSDFHNIVMSSADTNHPDKKPGSAKSKLSDLEIKDAHIIFESAWVDLIEDVGRENVRFPKEIILLGGAPGAGKGTNTDFIGKARGLTCPPVVISSLLDSPDAKRLKDAGAMVGDREVVGLLLRELMKPDYRDGVILDGFPRTRVQVECLKMIVDKMHQLRREFYGTPHGIFVSRPFIVWCCLWTKRSQSHDSSNAVVKPGCTTRRYCAPVWVT